MEPSWCGVIRASIVGSTRRNGETQSVCYVYDGVNLRLFRAHTAPPSSKPCLARKSRKLMVPRGGMSLDEPNKRCRSGFCETTRALGPRQGPPVNDTEKKRRGNTEPKREAWAACYFSRCCADDAAACESCRSAERGCRTEWRRPTLVGRRAPAGFLLTAALPAMEERSRGRRGDRTDDLPPTWPACPRSRQTRRRRPRRRHHPSGAAAPPAGYAE